MECPDPSSKLSLVQGIPVSYPHKGVRLWNDLVSTLALTAREPFSLVIQGDDSVSAAMRTGYEDKN